jgi:putative flippase GtrA
MTLRLPDAAARRQLAIYLTIGIVVFAIDTGSFQLLVLAHLLLPVAATLSDIVAVSTHFTLNRWLNFRNFDRGVQAQARTYAAIVFLQYLLTLLIIEGAVHLANASPLVAKIIAIAVNIPVGFLAHRNLTFAGGIAAGLRSFREGRRSSRA